MAEITQPTPPTAPAPEFKRDTALTIILGPSDTIKSTLDQIVNSKVKPMKHKTRQYKVSRVLKNLYAAELHEGTCNVILTGMYSDGSFYLQTLKINPIPSSSEYHYGDTLHMDRVNDLIYSRTLEHLPPRREVEVVGETLSSLSRFPESVRVGSSEITTALKDEPWAAKYLLSTKTPSLKILELLKQNGLKAIITGSQPKMEELGGMLLVVK